MIKIDLAKIKKLRKLLVLIPFSHRFVNKQEFNKFLTQLKSSESFSRQEIEAYQFRRLKFLLNIAYEKTLFYKQKYDAANFNPSSINSLDEIHKIPILTREEIRANSREMIVKDNKSTLLKGVTSGTSGHAIEVFYNRVAFSREWATMAYIWGKVGFRYGDGRVEFRAFMQEGIYQVFPETRVLRINILKMNSDNIIEIVDKINQIGYKFFHGYPSALYKFSKLVQEKNLKLKIKAFLFSSEMLYNWQVNFILKTFPDAKWIDFYGMAEHVSIALRDGGNEYKFIPIYGITEIQPQGNGIIGTSLTNEVMPLIRYQLSDAVGPIKQNKSSNYFPIVEYIHGRKETYTYDNSGNTVPPAVVTFPFKNLKKISACKLIQTSRTIFEFIVEGEDEPGTREEIVAVVGQLKKIFGDKSEFIPQIVPKIDLGKTGKFQWIECRYSPNENH